MSNANFQAYQPGLAKPSYPLLSDSSQKTCWVVVAALTAIIIVVYLDTLYRIASVWDSAQYSHGFMIPLFAAGLLYLRKRPFLDVPMWHRWVGVGLIVLGIALRTFGAYAVIFVADNLSFIPCLLGVFVLVGGLPTMRWAGPTVAFLGFMYPLPRLAEESVMHPLQRLATSCSQFVLVTLGVDSYREGNLIQLANRVEPMNVAEQCSGLRMLTIFTALAVAMALIFSDKTWWERCIVVLSAIPIALAVNVFRITLTGLIYSMNVGDALGDKVSHDLAGLIMMPLALGLLYLEIYLLGKIFMDVPSSPVQSGPINMGRTN